MNHLKVIKTEAEYAAAIDRFESLLGARPGQPGYDERDVLAVLIERYEEDHFRIDMPDPVEAIKFRMEQAGLSQKDLVPCLGSRSRVSEVLSGKRELTLAMIRSLNRHVGIPAEVLIGRSRVALPTNLSDLDFSRFPVREMERRGAFRGFGAEQGTVGEKAEEAIRWLISRVGGFSAVPQFALRKNDAMRLNAKLDHHALLGWSLQVLREATEISTSIPYSVESLSDRFIETLVAFSVLDDGPRHARDYLNKAGIVLITLRHLPRTYLDGAVFQKKDGSPVIALTLRYDRLDNFWFVLLHEIGHIKLGHISAEHSWIADDLDLTGADSTQEHDADEFAAKALLQDDFDLDQRETLTAAEVIQYARAHGVHPAIVAGRIQHARKDFRTFANLVGRGEVRRHLEV